MMSIGCWGDGLIPSSLKYGQFTENYHNDIQISLERKYTVHFFDPKIYLFLTNFNAPFSM